MNNKKILQKIVFGAAIVNNDKKILILQRNKNEDVFPNMWELPSGKKELLEESEGCLLREIKEETGFDVKIIIPFSVFDYKIEKPEEIRDTTQINFLVKKENNDEVKLSSEHQNYAWINRNEINHFDLSEATKKVIFEVFKLIGRLNE